MWLMRSQLRPYFSFKDLQNQNVAIQIAVADLYLKSTPHELNAKCTQVAKVAEPYPGYTVYIAR